MSVDNYRPLYIWRSPASIPQIVAHIQDYLVKHPILSTETIAEIIVDALGDHPELLNGSVIPITQDSAQSIKAYIDSLPILDTYTKAQIDALLDGKEDALTFDSAPTEDSANPVTSGGVYSALAALDTALQLMIADKADISSVYTKSQTDSLLLDKANADDVYSKNTIEAKLLTKADINSVYSIQDVDAMRIVNNANMAIRTTDNLAPIDISAGQYVYLGDILYMTTAPVLTGDELIPGTNCVLNPTGALNRIGDGLQNVAAQTNIQAGEITALQGDVSSLSGQIVDLQNNRVRRNISNDLTNLATAVAEQNLAKYGYAIGDYFEGPSGYKYTLADLDTFYGGRVSNAVLSTHHITIVVDTNQNVKWNSSNDTSTGYVGSNLHTYMAGTVLSNVKSDFSTLFGDWSAHLLSHHKMYSNGTVGWAWSSEQYISAFTSVQLYGSAICDMNFRHTGEGSKQLEVFQKYFFPEIFGNHNTWLRSVANDSCPCYATNDGLAHGAVGASNSYGAVGLIIFK